MQEAHEEHHIEKQELKEAPQEWETKPLEEKRKISIESKHAKYMPNWQRGDLKELTTNGHPKGAIKRNSMHVPIEHVNQKEDSRIPTK